MQVPQNPFPSQTWLDPHDVPAVTLPVPSTQVGAPVEHETMPLLQDDGFPLQPLPAVHETQVPEPLQTMLVPQPTPGDLLLPSLHVIAPVEQDVLPFVQTFGLVLHA